DLEDLVKAADRNAEGKLSVDQSQLDLRFGEAFSGRYWQLVPLDPQTEDPEAMLRSTSLWDQSLHLGPAPKLGVTQSGNTTGPRKQRLRYVESVISVSDDTAQPGPKSA